MSNLRLWISHNTGALIAVCLFLVLYVFYSSLHPRGFTTDLFVQNSNEALALIFVSMAQTLVVILGGIDVGTKEEIYRLLRELADAGTSIILYSTDYDELIGCCDRVLILYGGRLVRTLEGDDITETNIVASSFNLPLDSAAAKEMVRPQ